MEHPLPHGFILQSPGCHFSYRVIGPCCRLYDREQLPWPCCRLEWRGKEPSWKRIGRRFVPEMAAKTHPSYAVEIIGYRGSPEPLVVTLYPVNLSPEQREWWYSRRLHRPHAPTDQASQSSPPARQPSSESSISLNTATVATSIAPNLPLPPSVVSSVTCPLPPSVLWPRRIGVIN